MFLLCALQAAYAGDGGWTVVPFGVGVYVHHRPGRGVAYSVSQAVGAGVATWATIDADAAIEAEDDARFERDGWITGAGVGVFALSYAISLIDGAHLHDVQCAAQAGAPTGALALWDHGRERAAWQASAADVYTERRGR